MQLFVRRTLLWKYAAYFAGLVSLLLAASGAVSGYFAYRESVAALQEVQGATARYAAKEIGNFVRRVQDAMRISVAKFDVTEKVDTQDLQLELVGLLRHQAAISEMRWIASGGKEQLILSRFGPNEIESGRDWSADALFQGTRLATDFVGRVYFLKDTEPYVNIGVTSAPGGNVLAAKVNLKYVWDLVAQAHLKSGGVAYVVDRDGQLISHPDIALVLAKSNFSALPHVRRALERGTEEGSLLGDAHDVRGLPVVSIAVPVADLGWTVFAEQSLREAFRPVYASIGRSIALVLLGIVAAVGTSLLLARRMVRPIREIESNARELGHGKLDQRIDLHTGDELEGLATQFNRMAERLQETHASQEMRIAERTHDLALANEAKTRFLAAASHDLRQPIHALSLFVGELRASRLPQRSSALARQIEQSVESLSELLEALLDLSKLDVGAIHAEARPLALQPLLSRLAAQFEPSARSKGVALTQVRTSLWVHSDPLLLERILLNLIANAVRYTDRGRILVGCRRRGDNVELLIADTGIGIDPAHIANIFQEFFRAAPIERSAGGGLGLGLAIVKRLALLLNHRVDVESTLGKGTVMRVSLPRAHPQELTLEVRAAVTDNLRGLCVLVIDDEAPIREAMRGLLSRWHCEVMTAGSGAEALGLARLRRPDVVLCDLNLAHGESGIHVMNMLQSACGPALAWAFVTGESSPEATAAARNTGRPLVFKPTPAGKLRAVLEHLVSVVETS